MYIFYWAIPDNREHFDKTPKTVMKSAMYTTRIISSPQWSQAASI